MSDSQKNGGVKPAGDLPEWMVRLGRAVVRDCAAPGKYRVELVVESGGKRVKTKQGIERGEAQYATKMRDVKMDELDRLLADYKVIAEVALEDTPQLLEQLGWVVPS